MFSFSDLQVSAPAPKTNRLFKSFALSARAFEQMIKLMRNSFAIHCIFDMLFYLTFLRRHLNEIAVAATELFIIVFPGESESQGVRGRD